MSKVIKDYSNSLNYIETFENQEIHSTKIFINEVKKVLSYVEKKDLKGINRTIKKSKHLFKGNVGVRSVDYIGIKN